MSDNAAVWQSSIAEHSPSWGYRVLWAPHRAVPFGEVGAQGGTTRVRIAPASAFAGYQALGLPGDTEPLLEIIVRIENPSEPDMAVRSVLQQGSHEAALVEALLISGFGRRILGTRLRDEVGKLTSDWRWAPISDGAQGNVDSLPPMIELSAGVIREFSQSALDGLETLDAQLRNRVAFAAECYLIDETAATEQVRFAMARAGLEALSWAGSSPQPLSRTVANALELEESRVAPAIDRLEQLAAAVRHGMSSPTTSDVSRVRFLLGALLQYRTIGQLSPQTILNAQSALWLPRESN